MVGLPESLGDRVLIPAPTPTVAIVHDFLTQFGGGERTVLSMMAALPEAPIYTALYKREATYPEFATADVRPSMLNRVGPLRRNHRLALPVLGHSFSLSTIEADVALCSSAGWAHWAKVSGRKVVYCHAPARWLYGDRKYVAGGTMDVAARAAMMLRSSMRRWDQKAARSADRYLVNSSMIARQVESLYGIDAEVVPPPPLLDPGGPKESLQGCEPGYFLCVCRLLPYKNVAEVVRAFTNLPAERLVVVGAGPYRAAIAEAAPPNVRLVGSVADDQLRWLYSNCRATVSAAYEDFGLTPLEAGSFGRPAIVLRFGGFLDTVIDGETGLFFDEPDPTAIEQAIRELENAQLDEFAIRRHAERFSLARFVSRLREVVAEEAGR